jgi:uncharacterized membrane protein
MSAAHWHLMLNHIPLLGLAIGTVLLAYGAGRRHDDVQRASLGLLAGAGLSAIAVYLTGEPAEEVVEGLANVSHDALDAHEHFAIYALVGGIATGVAALGSLLYGWARRALARWTVLLTLVLALTTTGLLGYTANLGGKISHPELRGPTVSAVETGPVDDEPGAADETDSDDPDEYEE